MEGSNWSNLNIPSKHLLDFKSALPFSITIVLYFGRAEERHTGNVPARGTRVVFWGDR